MKKLLLTVVVILIVGVVGILTYVKTALPDVGGPPDIKVEGTQSQIERGKYLAETVSGCVDCHSQRDWSVWAGPVKEETRGAGGEEWNEDMGLPGTFYSRNITPHTLSDWTDGEIYRAITMGVNKDGEALFPVMPYHKYGLGDPEDIKAIIAYIRTLEPKDELPPEREIKFPMNFIINLIPEKNKPMKRPDKSNKIEYGKYMVTMAACYDCHTQMDGGEYLEGMDYAGGFEFKFPDGSINRSANITPHKETGIGNMTEDQFVARFKQFNDSTFSPHKLRDNEVNTVMPWLIYKDIKEEDLRAMYAYLMTVKPVKNEVKKFELAKK